MPPGNRLGGESCWSLHWPEISRALASSNEKRRDLDVLEPLDLLGRG